MSVTSYYTTPCYIPLEWRPQLKCKFPEYQIPSRYIPHFHTKYADRWWQRQDPNHAFIKNNWPNHYHHLFAHESRVCHSCAEKSIPLQASIQSSLLVVSVASVRQTPRDQSIVLHAQWVTGFLITTGIHRTHSPCGWFAILLGMMETEPGEKRSLLQKHTIFRETHY